MLTVDQVLRVIADWVAPIAAFSGDLSGVGVLAHDVRLDQDSPRFDRSQLDGYAVRSADARAGAALALLGQVDAGGAIFSDAVAPGTCVGINTGGVVPAGADAILMVEHALRETRQGREYVIVQQAVKPNQGVQRRGSDARAGEIILQAGTRLEPAQLALCAAAGVSHPLIRRPRVAVLSTGDELVAVDTPLPLPEGKIRNSNQVMLCALARQAGAQVLDQGVCRDEAGPLRVTLERALAEADLFVVCGGMSMGTRDLVPPLLKEIGVELRVEKVRIKPGKPFVLGTWEGAAGGSGGGRGRRYVAGLPGNPVSAFVTFQRLVRPMLRRMEGSAESATLVRGRLDRALAENGDREFYVPCRLHHEHAGVLAELLAWKGSADIFTLGKADGLVIQAAGAAAAAAGSEMDVLTW